MLMGRKGCLRPSLWRCAQCWAVGLVCVCFSLLKNTEEVLAYTLRQQGQDYVEVCLCTCELVCVQTSSVTGELRETMGKLDATIWSSKAMKQGHRKQWFSPRVVLSNWNHTKHNNNNNNKQHISHQRHKTKPMAAAILLGRDRLEGLVVQGQAPESASHNRKRRCSSAAPGCYSLLKAHANFLSSLVNKLIKETCYNKPFNPLL